MLNFIFPETTKNIYGKVHNQIFKKCITNNRNYEFAKTKLKLSKRGKQRLYILLSTPMTLYLRNEKQIEADVFWLLPGNITQSHKGGVVSFEGRVVENQSMMIKPTDKGSCIVVWDKTENLLEMEEHLSNSEVTMNLNLVKMNLNS